MDMLVVFSLFYGYSDYGLDVIFSYVFLDFRPLSVQWLPHLAAHSSILFCPVAWDRRNPMPCPSVALDFFLQQESNAMQVSGF